MRPSRQADPFTELGLPATSGLTDDEVRSAWRRIAAATHPDRADGGDPARFAAAAAAYTTLRTRFGRAEAFADLPRAGVPGRKGPGGAVAGGWRSRVLAGRPARLALRIAVAAAASLGLVLAAGVGPATLALITGALTWLVLTARHDLAPPALIAERGQDENSAGSGAGQAAAGSGKR